MNYDTTVVWHSQIDAYKDAAFILKKPSEGRRVRLVQKLADAFSRFRTQLAELSMMTTAAVEGEEEPKLDQLQQAKVQDLTDSIQQILSGEINPEWVRWALLEIEHWSFDGKPADVESFIENAPSDLYRELVAAIQAQANMSPAESKN